MDPNLFHVDWGRVFEVLVAIVILAFLVERALALLFETRFFINRLQGKNIKELIAFVVGAGVCLLWEFDGLSMIFLKEKVTWYGAIITGGVVAGGSKASIKLFKDILGFKSVAEAARLDQLKQNKSAESDKGEDRKGGNKP